MNEKNIYIYYPSKIVGGAEYLLKTTADLLKNKYKVIIVDIKDGWLSKNVEDVEVINLAKDVVYLDKDSILITPASCVRSLDLVFDGDFKVLSWMMQTYNVSPVFPKLGRYQFINSIRNILRFTLLRSEYEYYKRLINYLIGSNAFFIMDDNCSNEVYRVCGVRISDFLPVSIPSYKVGLDEEIQTIANRHITCCWLGRLDGEFKTPILNHLIKELSSYAKKNNINITLNVIGDGPGMASTKSAARGNGAVKCNFLSTMQGTELKIKLLESDIGFAMGTSALEIAALGVPTVLLDASYNKIPENYTYNWLHEAKNYNLGYMIENEDGSMFSSRKTISEIFSELIANNKELSAKDRKYVLKNHTEVSLEPKLINAINKVDSSFSDMKRYGLFEKPYWNFFKKYFANS